MSIFSSVKNVVSSACDLVAIGAKEAAYQLNKASNTSESITGTLATKAATMRANYEKTLADRKAGITTKDTVPVN